MSFIELTTEYGAILIRKHQIVAVEKYTNWETEQESCNVVIDTQERLTVEVKESFAEVAELLD